MIRFVTAALVLALVPLVPLAADNTQTNSMPVALSTIRGTVIDARAAVRPAPFGAAGVAYYVSRGDSVDVVGVLAHFYVLAPRPQADGQPDEFFCRFIDRRSLHVAGTVPALVEQRRSYLSPDRKLRATVLTLGNEDCIEISCGVIIRAKVGPAKGPGTVVSPSPSLQEARGGVRVRRDRILAAASYVSVDGSHGYTIAEAQWTADSRFFVYGLSNSGGHQPWNVRTYYFDRRTSTLRSLDSQIGAVTDSFELKAPDLLTTRILGSGSGASVTIQLSDPEHVLVAHQPSPKPGVTLSIGPTSGPSATLHPWVAFLKDGDIYAVRDDGSQQRQITTTSDVDAYAWMPDSAHFACIRGGQLWLVPSGLPAGFGSTQTQGEPTQVTDLAGWAPSALAISPNGTLIALRATRASTSGALVDGLIVLDLLRGKAKVIAQSTNGEVAYTNPAFTADGKAIVYSVEGESPQTLRLDEVVLATGKFHRIYGAGRQKLFYACDFPSCSLDGRWIACTTADSRPVGSSGAERGPGLVLLTARGTEAKLICQLSTLSTASWSADSRGIVYATGSTLMRIDLSTLKSTRIAKEDAAQFPTYQPPALQTASRP